MADDTPPLMLPPLRHFFGRFLAGIALLGYLAAAAEQVLPDHHDWDGGSAGVLSIAAVGSASDQPAPAPVNPVHVCHEGHQHMLILGEIASAPPPAASSASIPELTPATPALPPLRLSLRPPIA